jgi:hypothetical protein
MFVLACLAPRAHALTADEHRALALQAFAAHLRHLDVTVSAEALAEITVLTSGDDMSPSRFQVRGLTPFQQADAITPDRLDAIVADVIENPPTDNAFAPYADNVVANYVVYHTLALRCAVLSHADADNADPPVRRLPDRSEWRERALVFEAVALGYLADSFSSSHILTPAHLWLAGLQDANVGAAHDFFATQGTYVFAHPLGAARGVIWQTFGDGLLGWHGPAWEHAADACARSVSEVADLIARRRHPPDDTPIRAEPYAIPCPVVAAWHFSDGLQMQYREKDLHDPGLDVDRRFLYSRDAFPRIFSDRIQGRIEDILMLDTAPGVTAVEYHQTLDVAPAFAGILVMAGGGALVGDDGGGGVSSMGAGYGWEFRMPLLARLRTSLEAEYIHRLGDAARRVLTPRYTIGIGSPVLPVVEAVHLEAGYTWGLESPYTNHGVKWAVGADTRPLRFPFTYAGVSLRAKYERFWLDETLDGFQLQLVFR